MTTQTLNNIARAMVFDSKGLLAMDESLGTCNRRFADAGIPQTLEMRRAYRERLLKTPNLQAYISGVILYDEAIRQTRADGTPLVQVARNAGIEMMPTCWRAMQPCNSAALRGEYNAPRDSL